MIFDPWYFIILAPALLLGLWAQMRVKSAFAAAEQVPAPLSGAAAARHVLDSAGLQEVAIEPVEGFRLLRPEAVRVAFGPLREAVSLRGGNVRRLREFRGRREHPGFLQDAG